MGNFAVTLPKLLCPCLLGPFFRLLPCEASENALKATSWEITVLIFLWWIKYSSYLRDLLLLTVAAGFISASALPSKASKCLLISLFTSSHATRQSIFHIAASMIFLKHKSDPIPPCLKLFRDFLTQQGGKAKLLFPDDKFRHALDPACFRAQLHTTSSVCSITPPSCWLKHSKCSPICFT